MHVPVFQPQVHCSCPSPGLKGTYDSERDRSSESVYRHIPFRSYIHVVDPLSFHVKWGLVSDITRFVSYSPWRCFCLAVHLNFLVALVYLLWMHRYCLVKSGLVHAEVKKLWPMWSSQTRWSSRYQSSSVRSLHRISRLSSCSHATPPICLHSSFSTAAAPHWTWTSSNFRDNNKPVNLQFVGGSIYIYLCMLSAWETY
jgi:hypothetical protein